ncbi:MAG: cyclic nucleotide-binding domain-containing protein [Candidatus Riflebacteria bacterium]|nr:cyclic nucleotide-binding domain-containing protein [Candidatus Riflebacteria bacterium]
MSNKPSDSELIAKVSLFSGMNSEMRAEVADYIGTARFKAGDMILKEGETGDELLILVEGKVEISQTLVMRGEDQDFEEKDKTLIVLEADSLPIFGEMALLERSTRTATVKAIGDCVTRTLQRDRFVKFCLKNPQAGLIATKNLAVMISNRLRKANQDVLKLTTALSIVLKR